MNTSDYSFSNRHGLLLPRRDIARLCAPVEISMQSQISGRFLMEAVRPDGSRRFLAEFDNIITDAGTERWGTGAIISACRVGTGTSTPAVGNTGLDAQIASTTTITVTNNTAQATPPYFGASALTFRFAAGVATGNLSEVGVGWATTGSTLWSRALILDGGGAPTTITVLSDEVLDVTYTLRLYPPLTDSTSTVTISGTSYTITGRACGVTTYQYWFPGYSGVVTGTRGYTPTVYSGALGAITANSPSGTSSSIAFTSNGAYSATSRQMDANYSGGLDQGNVGGGIQSFWIVTSIGCYQFGFSPTLPKDATKVLSLTTRVSWARRP